MTVIHIILSNICIGNIKNIKKKFLKNYISFNYNNFNYLNIKKIIINLYLIKNYLKKILNDKKKILFVNTNNFLKEIIYKYSRSLEQYYICNKLIGGVLTNSKNFKKNLNKSIILKKKRLQNFTKKEKNIFLKKEKKIEFLYGGLKNMVKKPDLIFLTDIKKDKIIINEAKRLNIKIFALIDTDINIKNIDFFIPCNNNSINCVKYIFKILFSEIC
ncbi:ribosomal protein S2 [Candidatus Carsonella ruddii HT isolate Thao2000]|uniref:Small ribosomal subunit protein uS2 n=1 Tax=Candidatus Carsonella ruddii HT isolate Thao2000 TaxID=1202539 RepID=J3VQ55_CARRU|nr:30S ribosomal protein S2 [Candidatus Carsonella ruddii]AFP84066.1 ribosomal protein S2 [Candidatus Carsonella ruddii HT isolate Thao2000]